MSAIDSLPDRQVRARADVDGSPPAGLITSSEVLLPEGATILCLGGRLAPALGTVLETRGFRQVRTDTPHPGLPAIEPEAADYTMFGTGTGPIGSPAGLDQLFRRVLGEFKPAEDRRHDGDLVIDTLRPGLRYSARSEREFDVLTDRYLNGLKSAVRRAQVLVVALDTTEVCEAIVDGTVLPAWPDAIDPATHRIRVLSQRDMAAQLASLVKSVRRINPEVRVLFLVSPEPVAATMIGRHVLVADGWFKAALRLSIERLPVLRQVHYVPALELAAALGIRPEAASSDARYLSALAEAMISPELIEADPSAPEGQEDAGRAAQVDGAASEAEAAALPAQPATGKARKPQKAGRVAPKPAEAKALPPAPAAGRNRKRRPGAGAAPPNPAGDTTPPATGGRVRKRRSNETQAQEPAAAGKAKRKAEAQPASKRGKREAVATAPKPGPKPVLAAPVDQSGYKEPKRKRGKAAAPARPQPAAAPAAKKRGRRKPAS